MPDDESDGVVSDHVGTFPFADLKIKGLEFADDLGLGDVFYHNLVVRYTMGTNDGGIIFCYKCNTKVSFVTTKGAPSRWVHDDPEVGRQCLMMCRME